MALYGVLWIAVIAMALVTSACCVGWVPVALAEQRQVNWQALQLTEGQRQGVVQIEQNWQTVYNRIYPQIVRDREALHNVLTRPNTDEAEASMLRNRLDRNEQYLRQQAMEAYLQKKRLLNPQQAVRYVKLMPDGKNR
jgi:Spy/CpxP family protein refolding chaperone